MLSSLSPVCVAKFGAVGFVPDLECPQGLFKRVWHLIVDPCVRRAVMQQLQREVLARRDLDLRGQRERRGVACANQPSHR